MKRKEKVYKLIREKYYFVHRWHDSLCRTSYFPAKNPTSNFTVYKIQLRVLKVSFEHPWLDGIPAELFQSLKDDASKVLHSICHQIWKTQQCPQDWKRSVLSWILDFYWILSNAFSASINMITWFFFSLSMWWITSTDFWSAMRFFKG